MFALLIIFWFILNGRIAVDVAITAFIISIVVFLCMKLLGVWTLKQELHVYRLIPRGIMYFGLLIKEIFIANIDTMRLIFTRKLSPCIRTFKTDLKTPAARSMLANSITLTPGTVSIQLSDDTLVVHCLTHELADTLTDSEFENNLKKLEESANGTGV